MTRQNFNFGPKNLRLKAGLFFLLILLSLTFANASDEPKLETPDSVQRNKAPRPNRFNEDPVLEVEVPSFDLPFTTVGGLIIVKAKLDSLEGNFVFDTGAPYLVLNKTYFRDLERVHNQDDEQRGINGESGPSEKARAKHLQLGTFHYYKLTVDLVNLGPVENLRDIKILGLLGVSLFKQCEVMIDYSKNLIHLHYIKNSERKTYKSPLLQHASGFEEHKFDLMENRILLKTNLGKKKLRFVVDYGAESNVLDSRLPASVIDSVRIKSRIVLAGTDAKKVEALKGELPNLTFGNNTLDLPVVVTNLANSCFASDLCVNGVLGFEFLSRYRLIFNFVTRKLYVLK